MSRHRHLDGIGPQDLIRTKAFKLLNCEGRIVLHYIFTLACPKKDTDTLQDYVINEMKMEKNHYMKRFSKEQHKQILSDKTGNDFDISLLFRCLGLPLNHLTQCGDKIWTTPDDTKLEYLISMVKNHRNDLSHLKEVTTVEGLNSLATEVKKLLSITYQLAEKRYSDKCNPGEVDRRISEMKDNIDKIVNAPMGPDLQTAQIMKELEDQQKNHILDLTKYLKKNYKAKSNIHPASFITHVESLQIQSVYSKVEVVEELHHSNRTNYVEHDKMLLFETSDGQEVSVLVVEGEAGMGKTTLIKLILAEWANPPEEKNTIQGLHEYELLLHSECRNKSISSFLDLLYVSLGNTSVLLSEKQLETAVQKMKTLVLLDGADEWNTNSKKLLQDLKERIIPGSCGKVHLVCTTRPERLFELFSCLKPEKWKHIRLTGIDPDKQKEFISKFMHELQRYNTDDAYTLNLKKDIQEPVSSMIDSLEEFLKCSHARMGEQFKLPLNLALLTYLWRTESDNIRKVTTVTRLYTTFHDLAQKRLLERLVHGSKVRDRNEWKRLCDGFLGVLYEECLIALSQGALQMPPECTKELEGYCDSNDLPSSDLLENYMDVYREWGPHGYSTILAPPHKSKLEFLSALGFINQMCVDHNVQDILEKMKNLLVNKQVDKNIVESILLFAKGQLHTIKTIEDMLEKLHKNVDSYDISSYQNMFIIMAGILSKDYPEHLHKYGPELLKLLNECRVTNHQLLNLVAEAEGNDFFVKLVAQQLKKTSLEVKDGHVASALALLPHLAEHTELKIKLEGDPKHLPDLPKFLRLVASRECRVSLVFERLLYKPDCTVDHLLELLQGKKCSLYHLVGCLSYTAKLPMTIERLDLAAAQDLSPALPPLQDLPKLYHLDVHLLP
ncbi:uncharacterized protein LOC121862413 isoform X2 [Homarus americanus]|uniref:uncharacterized protein LOC121862413 isoform X2 n=1 Tax=Homarus americanus TaxID=6706 RepID=UPI001C4587E6|nr:uncharacterized protein LOC121862413 isoform X2 [Homarus americanus]